MIDSNILAENGCDVFHAQPPIDLLSKHDAKWHFPSQVNHGKRLKSDPGSGRKAKALSLFIIQIFGIVSRSCNFYFGKIEIALEI